MLKSNKILWINIIIKKKDGFNGEASSSSVKMGQQQENQYNTDVVETKRRKDAIKAEQGNKKRERIY